MKDRFLPSLSTSSKTNSNSGSTSPVWLRLAAFLSGKAPRTAVTYRSILSEWCLFLKTEPGSHQAATAILAATDLTAAAYRAWLGQRPGMNVGKSTTSNVSAVAVSAYRSQQRKDGYQTTLANATVAKKITALRRMYRCLLQAGIGLGKNPFDSDLISVPSSKSGQKRPTEMIPFELVQSILALPNVTSPKGLRDKAALAILFGGGLRRSEVVDLRLADLKRTPKGTTFVRLRATKGKKDSDQALPGWCAAAVMELCSARKHAGASERDFLFISYQGQAGTTATTRPLSDSGLYKLFKNYCTLAGVQNRATPHSARATAITKLLTQGISHREVQEFSRHASVQMVEVYDKRRISVDENPAKDLEFE